MTLDAENFRAALQWSQTHHRKEQLLRLAGNLGHFWYMCGRFSEAMLWIETALREVAPGIAVPARIKALYIVALIASHLGQSDLLFVRARECLALARQNGDGRGFVIASWPLVLHLLAGGDIIGARAQAEETLAFVQAHAPAEDSWTLACALNAFGSVVLSLSDYTKAQQLYERAIALFKEAGDLWLYGELHLFLANVYWAQGDRTKAQTFLKEGLAVHDQVGNAGWVTGWFVSLFGEIALRQGDIARARFLLEAGLKRHQQIGDQQGQALINALLAQAAASEQDYRTSKPQRPAHGRPGPTSMAQPLLDPLSEREMEVLQLLAGGASNQEIAMALIVTPGTVKLHVSHILSKLGVNSRTRAILRARDLGLLTME